MRISYHELRPRYPHRFQLSKDARVRVRLAYRAHRVHGLTRSTARHGAYGLASWFVHLISKPTNP